MCVFVCIIRSSVARAPSLGLCTNFQIYFGPDASAVQIRSKIIFVCCSNRVSRARTRKICDSGEPNGISSQKQRNQNRFVVVRDRYRGLTENPMIVNECCEQKKKKINVNRAFLSNMDGMTKHGRMPPRQPCAH